MSASVRCHDVRGKGSKLILSIVLKKFEILLQYGPLLQLFCEIDVELQSGIRNGPEPLWPHYFLLLAVLGADIGTNS